MSFMSSADSQDLQRLLGGEDGEGERFLDLGAAVSKAYQREGVGWLRSRQSVLCPSPWQLVSGDTLRELVRPALDPTNRGVAAGVCCEDEMACRYMLDYNDVTNMHGMWTRDVAVSNMAEWSWSTHDGPDMCNHLGINNLWITGVGCRGDIHSTGPFVNSCGEMERLLHVKFASDCHAMAKLAKDFCESRLGQIELFLVYEDPAHPPGDAMSGASELDQEKRRWFCHQTHRCYKVRLRFRLADVWALREESALAYQFLRSGVAMAEPWRLHGPILPCDVLRHVMHEVVCSPLEVLQCVFVDVTMEKGEAVQARDRALFGRRYAHFRREHWIIPGCFFAPNYASQYRGQAFSLPLVLPLLLRGLPGFTRPRSPLLRGTCPWALTSALGKEAVETIGSFVPPRIAFKKCRLRQPERLCFGDALSIFSRSDIRAELPNYEPTHLARIGYMNRSPHPRMAPFEPDAVLPTISYQSFFAGCQQPETIETGTRPARETGSDDEEASEDEEAIAESDLHSDVDFSSEEETDDALREIPQRVQVAWTSPSLAPSLRHLVAVLRSERRMKFIIAISSIRMGRWCLDSHASRSQLASSSDSAGSLAFLVTAPQAILRRVFSFV